MLKRELIVSMLVLGIFFSLTDARGGEINQPLRGTCSFSEQLKDAGYRSDYLERLTYLKQGVSPGQNDIESMYQEIAPAGYPMMRSNGLDPISCECMSCHDGSIAPATGYSHPVGMEYPLYSTYGRYFVARGALNRRIVLIDGKVGCLSCHNPLNPDRNHLVMNNDRSRLCLSCHVR